MTASNTTTQGVHGNMGSGSQERRIKYFDIFDRIPDAISGFASNFTLAQLALYAILIFHIGGVLFDRGVVDITESGYGVNLFTEFASIAVTVVVIERLAKRRADQERKKLLFAMIKSRESVVAILAFEELKQRGWIGDMDKENWQYVQLPKVDMRGLDLSGVNLFRANLSDADLRHANLSNASLHEANLSGTDWRKANLSGVSLWLANLDTAFLATANLSGAFLSGVDLSYNNLAFADFSRADLRHTNFIGARLSSANLSSADLLGANLRGAIMEDANLRDAKYFHRANFDENTILPDGSNWTPEADLTEFTSGVWHPREGTSDYDYWKRKGWLTPPDDDA